MKQNYIGGSFAPPLSEELLSKYKALIAGLGPQSEVGDIMGKLLACCEKWWALPDSKGTEARTHASGVGNIVPLEDGIAKELWDHIPWEHETAGYAKVLDGIDPVSQKELRDAAFHLLWHVRELQLDREPLTSDMLERT